LGRAGGGVCPSGPHRRRGSSETAEVWYALPRKPMRQRAQAACRTHGPRAHRMLAAGSENQPRSRAGLPMPPQSGLTASLPTCWLGPKELSRLPSAGALPSRQPPGCAASAVCALPMAAASTGARARAQHASNAARRRDGVACSTVSRRDVACHRRIILEVGRALHVSFGLGGVFWSGWNALRSALETEGP